MFNNSLQRSFWQGTVFWMAPEVIKQITCTKKSDIWSVGCLIIEMLTGEHPWPELNREQAIFQVCVVILCLLEKPSHTIYALYLHSRLDHLRNPQFQPIFLWNVEIYCKPHLSSITKPVHRPRSFAIILGWLQTGCPESLLNHYALVLIPTLSGLSCSIIVS